MSVKQNPGDLPETGPGTVNSEENKITIDRDELDARLAAARNAGAAAARKQKQASDAPSEDQVLERALEARGLCIEDLSVLQRQDGSLSPFEKLQRENKRLAKTADDTGKRLSEVLGQFKQAKARSIVTAVASEMNAHNADIVWASVGSRIQISDDGEAIVDGSEKPVKDFVKDFLNENDYLIKPSGAVGGGATGSDGTRSPSVDKLDPVNDALEIARLKLGVK